MHTQSWQVAPNWKQLRWEINRASQWQHPFFSKGEEVTHATALQKAASLTCVPGTTQLPESLFRPTARSSAGIKLNTSLSHKHWQLQKTLCNSSCQKEPRKHCRTNRLWGCGVGSSLSTALLPAALLAAGSLSTAQDVATSARLGPLSSAPSPTPQGCCSQVCPANHPLTELEKKQYVKEQPCSEDQIWGWLFHLCGNEQVPNDEMSHEPRLRHRFIST